MNTFRNARRLTALAILAAAALPSCTNLPRAKKGRARLELEVAVQMDDSFDSKVDGLDDGFRQQIAEQVLRKADLGLRFYPVLTERYAPDQARPQFLLTVQLSDFSVDIDRDVKRHRSGGVETIETSRWLERIHCTATVAMEKRRNGSPSLLVDRDTARVDLRIRRPHRKRPHAVPVQIVPDAVAAAEAEVERRQKPGQEKLALNPEAVPCDAAKISELIDRAVQTAMKKTIKAIDQELLVTHEEIDAPQTVALRAKPSRGMMAAAIQATQPAETPSAAASSKAAPAHSGETAPSAAAADAPADTVEPAPKKPETQGPQTKPAPKTKDSLRF